MPDLEKMEMEKTLSTHTEDSFVIAIDKEEKAANRVDFELAMKDLKKVAREGITMAGGPVAILLQIAHPAVGQGVADHSTFNSRAISRAQYTQMYIYTMIFGNEQEKAAVKAWVDGAHARVVADGKVAYNATDPELQLWVATTIYACMVAMYELTHGPLPPAKAERVYQAFSVMGTSLQMPREMWPKDLRAFKVYWKDMIENHLRVTPEARGVYKDLFHPTGLPLWLRTIFVIVRPFLRPIVIEQLPPEIREQFHMKSTKKTRAIAGLFISGMTSIYPFIPLPIRQVQKTYNMRLLRKRMKKRGGQLVRQ
ncbi:hypothetical protein AJ79_00728 [Helicocarpus griseus UAMH5409]|uniref:ER-bound oxygenase mpaB/mpaB'/Rubber oxygenase catalytic domain-containing protein n=1 Tax=Helicocarpus griseus UAMH5409 TaxID=1447875 RepID=A0A2B7YA80_9EURO|nr:hypothetical protein AJ79_00728 [Helicocarpus griseus UAMH5409]